MEPSLAQLETIAQESRKSVSEVMSLAFQAGIRQLWRDHILGAYLRKKISRDEAIETVGIDYVELAERQHTAMLEDVNWALEK